MVDFTLHALNRCVERHGFLPDLAEAAAAVRAIRSGRNPMLRRSDNGGVFLVELSGNRVEVVYDSTSRAVVTVLPARTPLAKLVMLRNHPGKSRARLRNRP